jgi:hypothetical protein
LSWNSFRTLSVTPRSLTKKFTLVIVLPHRPCSQPHCCHRVTLGVTSWSQLELCSHYNLFGVTFVVASQSQRHSRSPYNIFGVIFGVRAVNPIATAVSYGVEFVSWGLSLPTTYLPPSLSAQHFFNTDIYSTSLHTQADTWLFSALLAGRDDGIFWPIEILHDVDIGVQRLDRCLQI